jgi:hypothetical protein
MIKSKIDLNEAGYIIITDDSMQTNTSAEISGKRDLGSYKEVIA